MPVIAVFMVINIILGCYVAIRLGYGPPNWQKALNLIIPLTTLQDGINDGRDWFEARYPWAVKYLSRLNIPKPTIFIDVTAPEEGTEEDNVPVEEAVSKTSDEIFTDQADIPNGQADATEPPPETKTIPE